MRSTFMGLEASKRGLFTQQSALYTTGHNISNANTEGYSRQRVDMAPTQGYPGIGLNAPKTPGFIGTGVEATAVERIRDKFVDTQYRQETSKLGYWSTKSHSITQVEDILKEPSDYGLAQSLNEFWNSLQDLNVRPKDGGARAVVVQRAVAVTDSFHYMHNSIKQIRENTGAEIGILLRDANSVLKQIAEINFQIQSIEPNGYMPNDLYDARDNLIDQLSTYFPIDISYTKSGGNSLPIAEGSVTVTLKVNGAQVKLVEGNNHAVLSNDGENTLADGVTPTKMVTGLVVSGIDNQEISVDINDFNDVGKYKSLVDSYGYASTDGSEKGFLPEMLENIDKLAKAFAEEFNKIHSEGTDLSGASGGEFFVIKKDSSDTSINAGNITVSQEIIDDPNLIAASDSEQVLDTEGNPDSTYAEPGNGNNALKLANMKFNSLKALDDVSAQSYFEGLIGQLGVDGQQASRLQYNAETLQQAVQERRDSVSSVSLDEEMTNMITFQKAYNANARMITVIDETLDKIINGMGRVGL
ncbi:flagellar hook-associated protein FlgK [Lysinibacillus endophyticus]|uniref:flagellar hook-associated protein FlgK n=1 Tax=Ureibacillus endophyticus TaxID=1978490 RepID=UPI00209D8923|nr:flagellar hook-associated protein FlgK [Lysinibacillus endophyticus]MCP1143735.1 flagellar hook-associated protein FlgK [Lysinibacillus endophyticus]